MAGTTGTITGRVRRNEDNRWQIQLPWRGSHSVTGEEIEAFSSRDNVGRLSRFAPGSRMRLQTKFSSGSVRKKDSIVLVFVSHRQLGRAVAGSRFRACDALDPAAF